MKKIGWCAFVFLMVGLSITRPAFAGEFQPDDNTLFLAHYNTTIDADFARGNPAHDPLDSACLTRAGGYSGGGLACRVGTKALQEAGVDAKDIAAAAGKNFDGLRYYAAGNLGLAKGTFECRYKPYFSIPQTDNMPVMHVIFEYRESATKYLELCFNRNPNGSATAYFLVVDGGAQPKPAVVQIGVPVEWEPATWHHVAVTWDTTTEKPGAIALFLDDILVGKQSLAGIPGGFLKPAADYPSFSVGAHLWRGSGDPRSFNKADGVIDEVRISNTVRYTAQKSGPLNVRDFGAKGDGITDDGDAIQRCLLKAAASDYPRFFYRGYVAAPEVFFPKGTYLVSRTLLVPPCAAGQGYNLINLRGEGATIKQMNPAEDILYFRFAFRNLIEGLTFEGGKRQIKLWSNNLDTGHIIIRDCVFRNSSSYAIDDQLRKNPKGKNWYDLLEPFQVGKKNGLPVLTPVEETQAPMFGYVSTCFRISRCSFQRCMNVLSGWADWILMDECTIETNPDMDGPAILTGGGLMLENITGLARTTPGRKQWWITMDPQKQPAGEVGINLENVKLKSDSKNGFCVIRNETKFTGGNHTYVTINNGEFQSAGSQENSIIYLVEAPNLISVRNCRETSGRDVNILGFAKPFEEDYFHAHSPEVFSYLVDDNNRGLTANLPESMARFADKPLPEEVARRFEQVPPLLTLSRMREKVAGRINLADFGSDGTGTADDSDSFRKAFAAAGKAGSPVEVVVPNGLYRMDQPVELPPRIAVRGSGHAAFTVPAGRKGAIFTASGAEHILLQNLHFFKCEQAVAITTKADVKSDILLDNCVFNENSDCAVTCFSGSGAVAERNKTTLRMSDCTFVYSRALRHNVQYALMDNPWITTDPDTVNSGVVVNKGTFHLKSLCGVPSTARTYKAQDSTDTRGNDLRWIDNYYQVFLDRCRFGGEGGGLPMVINFATGGYVLIQNSWLSIYEGNPKRITVVDCEEIPSLIALRGNWGWPWPQMMVTIRSGAHGDLKGRFFESDNTAPPSMKDERKVGK